MIRRFALLSAVMFSVMGVQSTQASEVRVKTEYRGFPGNAVWNGQDLPGWVTYVNLVVAMPLCHELTLLDVDAGDPPLKAWSSVSGRIGDGCLVMEVTIRASMPSPAGGQAIVTHRWSEFPGVPGGTWNYVPEEDGNPWGAYHVVKE